MSTQVVAVEPAKWVRPNLLPSIFGITAGAARKYRERGEWLEGTHFKQKGRNYWYNRVEIDNWVEQG